MSTLSTSEIIARFVNVEKRLNELLDLYKNSIKLRQLSGMQVRYDESIKELEAKIAELTVKVERLEKR
jgi:hypothetical protein